MSASLPLPPEAVVPEPLVVLVPEPLVVLVPEPLVVLVPEPLVVPEPLPLGVTLVPIGAGSLLPLVEVAPWLPVVVPSGAVPLHWVNAVRSIIVG